LSIADIMIFLLQQEST